MIDGLTLLRLVSRLVPLTSVALSYPFSVVLVSVHYNLSWESPLLSPPIS